MSSNLLSNPFENVEELSANGKFSWSRVSIGLPTRIVLEKISSARVVIGTSYELSKLIHGAMGDHKARRVEGTLRSPPKAELFSFHEYHHRRNLKNTLLERIRYLLSLPVGWDGYCAAPPSAEAINDAEQFSSNVLPNGEFTLPSVTAASDGEVNFSWKNSSGFIDLGFYGDSTYSYYVKFATGEELICDESPLSQPLPEKVFEIVRGN